ncbi:hypothetical protein AB0869_11985 [Micromonospora vinacea]|uniref:hypothetical protein n=1 Tax=Micromonospora vinacea TaxID=709878 RepID=UPI00345317DC
METRNKPPTVDVFYVAMFAQLSSQLATNPTWGGVGQGLILLLAAWCTWAGTAIDTELLGQLPASRLAWLALLVGTTPALATLTPILVALVTVGVLVGITLTDAWRLRRAASTG